MELNDIVYVRYIGDYYKISLIKGKIYKAKVNKHGWYAIFDETKDIYAFPPAAFEVVDKSEFDKQKAAKE